MSGCSSLKYVDLSSRSTDAEDALAARPQGNEYYQGQACWSGEEVFWVATSQELN